MKDGFPGNAAFGMTPMRFESGLLRLLDQRALPREERWIECRSSDDVVACLESAAIHGGSALGCAAAFGMALDTRRVDSRMSWNEYYPMFLNRSARLAEARPGAANLIRAIERLKEAAAVFPPAMPLAVASGRLEEEALAWYHHDAATCRVISNHGALLMKDGEPRRVMTLGNAGALASAAYGTALGVVRAMSENGRLRSLWVAETGPTFAGSRLTAWEMSRERIPVTLVNDSAVAEVIRRGLVDVVIVGAESVAPDGMVSAEVGTYAMALAARFHGIPFYVAAALTTFDAPIEASAMKARRVAVSGMTDAAVDAFETRLDSTPGALVTGFLTDEGILYPPYDAAIAEAAGRLKASRDRALR